MFHLEHWSASLVEFEKQGGEVMKRKIDLVPLWVAVWCSVGALVMHVVICAYYGLPLW